ncbi:hypothetical protein BGX21_000156 [Mortierella sp. AD011]|nr:hypothetical protein BGX21_000156 [Mortierella sp. AD011]
MDSSSSGSGNARESLTATPRLSIDFVQEITLQSNENASLSRRPGSVQNASMSDLRESGDFCRKDEAPFHMNRDLLSRLYVVKTVETGCKYLLRIFPDRDPFNHPSTSIASPRNGGDSLHQRNNLKGSQGRDNLKEMVQNAIENELGAIKWCQTRWNSEGLVVPEILGFAHYGCKSNVGACLDMFSLMGLILMKYPHGGALYQDLIVDALDRNSKDIAQTSCDITEEPPKPIGLTVLSSRALSKLPQRTVEAAHDPAGSSCEFSQILDDHSSSLTHSEQNASIGRTRGRLLERINYFEGSDPPTCPLPPIPSSTLPRQRRKSSASKLAAPPHHPSPKQILGSAGGLATVRHDMKVLSNVESRQRNNSVNAKGSRPSSWFDQDPTIYCSYRTRESVCDKIHDRGDISRLEFNPSSSLEPDDDRPSSASVASAASELAPLSPLSPLAVLQNRLSRDKGEYAEPRQCMAENFLCWPTKFIHPTAATTTSTIGHGIHTSVVEYEQAQLINALVALEKLDSHPESTCRFPQQLFDLLKRILCIAHDELLFAGSNLDIVPRRRVIAKVPFEMRAFIPSSVFTGTTTVFTHNHLDPSSFIINRQSGGILALFNFQHAGFLPSYAENVQTPFIEMTHSSFWNVDNPPESSSGDSSGDEIKKKSRLSLERPKFVSFMTSSSSSSSSFSQRNQALQTKEGSSLSSSHQSFSLVLSPQPCPQRQQEQQEQQEHQKQKQQQTQRQQETEKDFSSSVSRRISFSASYPVINHYPAKGFHATCESIEYSEYHPSNPVTESSSSGTTLDTLKKPRFTGEFNRRNSSDKNSAKIRTSIQSRASFSTLDPTTTAHQPLDQEGSLSPKSPRVNQSGWTEFMECYRDLEQKGNRRSRIRKASTASMVSAITRTSEQNNSVSFLPPPLSVGKTKDSAHFENGHGSKALEALVSISKTLQNLVVVLEAGGIVLTPDQLLDAVARKKEEWEQEQFENIKADQGRQRSETVAEGSTFLGIQSPITTTVINNGCLQTPTSQSSGFLKTIFQMITKKKPKRGFSPIMSMYRPERTSSDNILYSSPGVQRDPLPSELPDHLFLQRHPSSPSLSSSESSTTTESNLKSSMIGLRLKPNEHEEIIVPIASNPILGSITARKMPAFGIQLSNLERTKALAQIEMEKIEAQERQFWREFEGLCDHLEDCNTNDNNNNVRETYPGLALLRLDDLESCLEIIENYVSSLEVQAAKYYLSLERKSKSK